MYGKFIGSAPSYGYLRDPNDKGHLIPDSEYAWVVKKIFDMAYNGVGLSEITTYLNDNNIKTLVVWRERILIQKLNLILCGLFLLLKRF